MSNPTPRPTPDLMPYLERVAALLREMPTPAETIGISARLEPGGRVVVSACREGVPGSRVTLEPGASSAAGGRG